MNTNYNVEFEISAQKTLKKMDRHQALLIMGWISKNLVGCRDPRVHGKALVSDHKGKWRYRIGDYRVIADINDETVTLLVLAIGHRRKIHKSIS